MCPNGYPHVGSSGFSPVSLTVSVLVVSDSEELDLVVSFEENVITSTSTV